jgi:protein-tyrosine phosphatase
VIDLHCHVLAGIDDGPKDIEGSLALAREACAVGIGTLVATPHVNWRFENRAGRIATMVAELNGLLESERIAVEVRAGGEVALTRADELGQEELEGLHLGGGEWLLVEPPVTPVAVGLEGMVAGLQARGHRVLLAHPERCAPFHRDPQMLASLVRSGALVSITAGSLVGEFGAPVRRFALELAREGLVHNVVSDAHDHIKRPPGMRAALERSGLDALAQWLTLEVPGAILDGGEIPPRPNVAVAPPRARGGWLRRRRLLGEPSSS